MRLYKAFAYNSSAITKLLKTQLHKVVQSGRFLARASRPLLETGFLLIKVTLKALAKSILMPLMLTAAATDAAIQKKIFGSDMLPSD